MDIDNFIISIFVAIFVCAISCVSYFMFKRAAVIHSTPITMLAETIVHKKKKKKPDNKKMKKNVRLLPDEHGWEKVEFISENPQDAGEVSPNVQQDHSVAEFTPNEAELSSNTLPETTLVDNDVFYTNSDDRSELTVSNSSPRILTCNAETSHFPDLVDAGDSVKVPERKSKKLKVKHGHASEFSGNVPRSTDQLSASAVSSNNRSTSIPQASPSNYDQQLATISKKLRETEAKLSELSAQSSTLLKENKRLCEKEEENALGYRVLQQQYTELLKTNRSLEHDNSMKDASLKELAKEKNSILKKLDEVTIDASRRKEELDREVRGLQEQIIEAQSKLSVLASSPTPNPELARTKELAQLMSNENIVLNNTLKQLENELNQLRQTSLIQQQEVQRLRNENIKFRSDHESILEEVRLKQQAQSVETTKRLSTFEAELQRKCREFDAEKQDLLSKLTDTRSELSATVERESHLKQVLSSMEYQFAELRAEKERLQKQVDVEAKTFVVKNELVANLASVTHELTETKKSLSVSEAEVVRLTQELKEIKMNLSTRKQEKSDNRDEQLDRLKNSENALQLMRSQLREAEERSRSSANAVQRAEQAEALAKSELMHYKTALIQTEGLLANLQQCVQDAEHRWSRLLARSESECQLLKAQLKQRSMQQVSSSNSNSMQPDTTNFDNNSERSMPRAAHTKEVDSDFDAVLVDGGDSQVSDASWDSTTKQYVIPSSVTSEQNGTLIENFASEQSACSS